MSNIKLVTPPRKSKSPTKDELLTRIEELESDLVNERQRADELSDKLSQYENDTHDYLTLTNRNDLLNYETDSELLQEIRYFQDEVRIARERKAMGVPCDDELTTMIEKLLEMEL